VDLVNFVYEFVL